MIQTLDTVFGPSVTVRVTVKDTAEVIFRYSERTPSADASGIVNVSLASAAMFLVPRLNASAIRARLVLVLVPQVPSSSPVVIS
jgi:flagellar basal body rod protein FlgC